MYTIVRLTFADTYWQYKRHLTPSISLKVFNCLHAVVYMESMCS